MIVEAERRHRTGSEHPLLVESGASVVPFLLAQGPIFVALALFFRIDVVLLGLVAAVPMLVQSVQLAGPWLVRRARSPLRLFRIATAFRWSWALLIGAAVAGARSPALFLAVFLLTQTAAAVAGNAWMSILQVALHPDRRGTFFGRRNALVAFVTIAAMPVMSAVLDTLADPWNVIAVITVGILANAIAWVAIGRVAEAGETPKSVRIPVRELLADEPARRMIAVFVLWNAVIQFSAPYFSFHQIANLGIPLPILGAQIAVTGALSIAGSRGWGAVADRTSASSVTIAGISVIAATPVFWLLMNPVSWPVALAVDSLLAAVGWSAINVGLMALPMETAPREHVSGFYAVYFASGGFGGLVGGALGAAVSSVLDPIRFELFEVPMYGLQLLLLIAVPLRLLIIPLLRGVPTRRSVSASAVFADALATIARRTPIRPVELGRVLVARIPARVFARISGRGSTGR